MVAGLAGCQLLGWNGEPEQPGQAALQGEAQGRLEYPDLHTVPPRPQLSYSVEQRREIVERLISDRAHARYTEQRIRYESGLSSLPPPPQGSTEGAAAEGDQIVQARAQAPAAEPDRSPADQRGTGNSGVGDTTLNDFLVEMVRETAPTSVPPAGSAAPADTADNAASAATEDAEKPDGEPAAPPSASPSAENPSRSLSDRLFGWIGDLFGEDQPAEQAPTSATPAADPPLTPSGGGTDGGAPLPADGMATQVRPLLKPALAASPPRPSPGKPMPTLASGVERSALAVIAFSPGSATLASGSNAALGEAWAAAAGAPIEVRAGGGGRALATDRARAVALALLRAGARPDDLELVVSGTGPDEVRVVPFADPS